MWRGGGGGGGRGGEGERGLEEGVRGVMKKVPLERAREVGKRAAGGVGLYFFFFFLLFFHF